jgi:radical SAM protein with 4Fe4S-binding SPASM domain
MIDISFLYCGRESRSVSHRYGEKSSKELGSEEKAYPRPRSASERKPIVVWNITRTCNLKCLHCYSDSEARRYAGELDTEEAKAVIDDLALFQVPAILFSGGEPLLRSDLLGLAQYAKEKGLRTVLSSNGTLIDSALAQAIKEVGFSYVGISLDGIGQVHDYFRGLEGAFDRTLQGIRNLVAVGQKTGLRLTLTEHTADEIDSIFDLIEQEGIRRVCFYHLVPSGRGKEIFTVDLEKTRWAVDKILERMEKALKRGLPLEVLTVDNHADGPYLYLKLKQKDQRLAEKVYEQLCWNGGALNSSGVGISCIDSQGNVHTDQFWTHYSLGNVREQRFSKIWTNPQEPLLQQLRMKNRKDFIHGRCRMCRFFNACGGGLRVRTEIGTGDLWASDPACYLTDEEIKLGG